MRRAWHKRYHSDALNGVMDLTLEERGAYATILDLLYQAGQPVAYEGQERLMAGRCQCSVRKIKTIVASLIARGKLLLREDGALTNRRFEKEMHTDQKQHERAVATGRVGGRKSRENAVKNARKSRETLASRGENVVDINEIKKIVEGGLEGASSPRARYSETQRYIGLADANPVDVGPNDDEGASATTGRRVAPRRTALSSDEQAAFDEFWTAASAQMRRRSCSRARLAPIWRRAVEAEAVAARGGAPALTAALRRYLAEDADVRADRGQPALERWLANGRYEAWLAPGAAGAEAAVRRDVSDEVWQAALRQHASHGRWPAYLGPAPGEPGHGRLAEAVQAAGARP